MRRRPHYRWRKRAKCRLTPAPYSPLNRRKMQGLGTAMRTLKVRKLANMVDLATLGEFERWRPNDAQSSTLQIIPNDRTDSY